MTPDFERIKKTTDLVAVVEGYGIALKKTGKDHVGLCPFHDDHNPSLVVTQGKGLFHCPACGAAGNVIQFVARREGITDKEAAKKLLGGIPGVKLGAALAAPVAVALPDPVLFGAVIDHCHEALFSRDRRGLDYLKKRGLGDVELLKAFRVGFANGTLPKKLSPAQVGALQGCGLFNEAGNEKFYLRVVVPIHDEAGRPVGLYGRRITDQDSGNHLYLEGGHRAVWHSQAAQVYPDELIVTESILDALSIYAAGKKNVLAAYGTNGWTAHHAALIEKHRVKKIVLAFDRDKGGDEAAEELAPALVAQGVRVHRIHWPEGVKDANQYFAYTKACDFRGTPETFAALAASAPRIGFTRSTGPKLAVVERTGEAVTVCNGTVDYRVKGMSATGALRVVLSARRDNGAVHVDHLDLYASKARKMFSTAAAQRLGVEGRRSRRIFWRCWNFWKTCAARTRPRRRRRPGRS
jgi:DNA primase catalytic core